MTRQGGLDLFFCKMLIKTYVALSNTALLLDTATSFSPYLFVFWRAFSMVRIGFFVSGFELPGPMAPFGVLLYPLETIRAFFFSKRRVISAS